MPKGKPVHCEVLPVLFHFPSLFLYSYSQAFILPLENFLKMMEKDAKARRVRRAEKEKIATGVWFSVPSLCSGNWTVCCTYCSVVLPICPFKPCPICITAALKDRGNEAYAQEDFETAVKFYTDGLAELRDMQPLYTNRAQVISFSMFNKENSNWVCKLKSLCTSQPFCHKKPLEPSCRYNLMMIMGTENNVN